MTDPKNGLQMFLILCVLMMVAAPLASWSVIPDRRENSVRLWFIGSVMLALVGIIYYGDPTAVTLYYAPNVGAALFALEALRQEQRPRPVPWGRLLFIMAVVMVVHEWGHLAVQAGRLPEAFLLGPRVLLVAVLDVVLIVLAVRLSRLHRSRGMALVALGIAPLALINVFRVLAIASGSTQMGPQPNGEVFPAMAMIMTFTAVTYNFGFLAYALEKSHIRSERALEEAARAQEREAAALAYSSQLQILIDQRDEMLMNSARLSAVRAMGLYNSAIVHEISQPLQAMRSVLDGLLLKMARPGFDRLEEIRVGIGQAIDLHGRSTDLIKSLRRLIAARPASLAPVALHEAIQAVLPILDSECKRRDIVLKTNLSPDVEALRIQADELILQRALLNLVGNSMDALGKINPPGREIRLTTEPASIDGQPAVLLRIEDSGPGFPPEILEAEGALLTTHKFDGVGMGMALTRLMTDAWKGSLKLGAASPGDFRAPRSPGQGAGARVDLLLRCA